MDNQSPEGRRCGWCSDIPTFQDSDPRVVVGRLGDFVRDAGPEQWRSWRSSVPWLQDEFGRYIATLPSAANQYTVLEYELPRDFRRPDVIVLRNGTIVILELKGYPRVTQAALDQVLAYARDIRAYHVQAQHRSVVPVLVTPGADAVVRQIDGVTVLRPKALGGFLTRLADGGEPRPISATEFLRDDAYAPLPTIVQAARDLFHKHSLPRIKRARAVTDPAINAISEIAHRAATEKNRHLVLVSGVPGAGKTLVGLQVVHAGWLDDLAVERSDGKPTAPAVYLSGNGPLVQVLQDALKEGGGGGRTFVQAIKSYVAYYSKSSSRIPPEHLIVFDEAQRAHDAGRVAQVHRSSARESEPEHLVKFCNRIPEWSVLVGLIGTGQAIHVGEEGGIPLWVDAVRRTGGSQRWIVHCAPEYAGAFNQAGCQVNSKARLNLDTEIRFHLAPNLHRFVDGALGGEKAEDLRQLAQDLHRDDYRLLITRDLETAKCYLLERYADAPEARYGILASSKDKWLESFGVDNSFQTTKRLKVGPWYNAPPSDSRSCCQLDTVATEFSSQGLELDAVVLAWGSDLLWEGSAWSMKHSRGTRGRVHNPLELRKNVYRVLLTRGRDGTVVFVPRDSRWDRTAERLRLCGFRPLDESR